MGDILLKGQRLELYRDEQWKVEKYSAWFQEEIRDDLVLPLKVPYMGSYVNRKLMGFIDVPAALYKSSRIRVMVTVSGSYRWADMVLRKLDEDLTVNLYLLSEQFSVLNMNLQELDIPNAKNVDDLYHDGVHKTWPEAKAYFPMVFNPIFYDDREEQDKKNPEYEWILNGYNKPDDEYVVNYASAGTTYNRNTLVPMVALMEVLETGMALDGYRLTGEFYHSSDWRRAFIYSNLSLDRSLDTNTIMGISTYGINLPPQSSVRIPFTSGSGNGVNLSQDQYEVHRADLFKLEFRADIVPSMNTASFEGELYFNNTLLQSSTYIIRGGTIRMGSSFNWSASDLGKPIYIKLRNSGNGTAVVELKNVELKVFLDGDIQLIDFSAPSNLSAHLPDMTFAELLNILQRDLNYALSIDPQAKTLELVNRTEALSLLPQGDFSDKVMGEFQVQFGEREELLMKHNPPGEYEENLNDSVYTDRLLLSTSGDVSLLREEPLGFSGEAMGLDIHPLVVRKLSVQPYPQNEYGVVFERGRSKVIDTNGRQPSMLRIGFLKWLDGYPVSSNHLGKVDLRLSYDPESIALEHLLWHRAIQEDPRDYSVQFLLSRQDLNQLDINSPLTVKGVKYLVRELRYQDEGQDLLSVDCVLKRV